MIGFFVTILTTLLAVAWHETHLPERCGRAHVLVCVGHEDKSECRVEVNGERHTIWRLVADGDQVCWKEDGR